MRKWWQAWSIEAILVGDKAVVMATEMMGDVVAAGMVIVVMVMAGIKGKRSVMRLC